MTTFSDNKIENKNELLELLTNSINEKTIKYKTDEAKVLLNNVIAYLEEIDENESLTKGELYRINGLLIYLKKCISDENINTKTDEAKALLKNIIVYLSTRYQKIERFENKIDENLYAKSNSDSPKLLSKKVL